MGKSLHSFFSLSKIVRIFRLDFRCFSSQLTGMRVILRYSIRVYYENTDAGGVVYHAQYLNFFERARTEALRQLGFSQQTLLQQDIAFVVKKIEIEYQAPARLDDSLLIETEVIELKKASIVFWQRLYRDDRCLCEAKVQVVSVDLTKMKPIAIPEGVYQALQAER